MRERHIRITGRPRREVDVDLLVEALVYISEQRLRDGEVVNGATEHTLTDEESA